MSFSKYEASTVRRRLSGQYERRGSQTGLSTWGAFAFGAVFVAMGTFIILVGTRVIPVDPRSVHAPWWVLAVCGAVFALGGLMVWSMAWKQYRANRRRLESSRDYRDEPALADYAWDTRSFEAPRWKRAGAALGGALFFTLFLSIFNWWAFFAKGPWPVKIIVILFDLILIAVWWQAMARLGRALKFGGSRIEFGRFPFSLTEPVVLYWQAAPGVGRPSQGTFTLRCVEEWMESRGHGKSRSTHLMHEELWSGTWRLDPQGASHLGKRIEVRFELPADALPTRLSAEKPVFWELEVKLDLPGLDFEEKYLVPIYAPRELHEPAKQN